MLRQILALFEANQGHTLSKEAIRNHLNVSPALLDQMLLTLVQRGRLEEVDSGCTGCDVCPLEHFCATSPTVSMKGYTLVEPHANQIRNAS